MLYGYIMVRSQIDRYRHEKGFIESGMGSCGSYAHKVKGADQATMAEINSQYDAARERMMEAQEQLNNASNFIARLFAKRRYSAAAKAEARLFQPCDPSELLK